MKLIYKYSTSTGKQTLRILSVLFKETMKIIIMTLMKKYGKRARAKALRFKRNPRNRRMDVKELKM
jgi:hypothetical protein